MACEHLRAQTNAEIGFLVAKRHADPVDFATEEIFIVVRALRAAEYRRTGVLVHGLRQRIAETRAPDVEWMAEFRQCLANTSRRRMLLMQNEKNRLQHG